jgi:hypothetical protein
MTRMYEPAAFRNRDCAWDAEVANMYPTCLIGSRTVALMERRALGLAGGWVVHWTLKGAFTQLVARGKQVPFSW